MASKQKEHEEYEAWQCPYKELTDVGIYSYASLCAVALNKLFEHADCDKKFIEHCIDTLTKHLEAPEQVRNSTRSLANDVDMDDESAFINCLKEEEIIKKEGLSMIPKDMVLLALTDGGYDSRMRVLIKFISMLLRVDFQKIEEYEEFVVERFEEKAHQISEEEAKEKEAKGKTRKYKKYALIGVATIGGGALLGLTGGLAAPLIAGAAGAIIGGTGAAVLGSTAGIAIMGSLFGVAGAGLGGYKMNRRIGDVEEFKFEPLSEGRELHVTIAVAGWITDDSPDFCTPWRGLANSKEQYTLRYESKYLKEWGGAMNYVYSAAVSQATQQALKYTVLSGLLAAIAWPATILSAASLIDNPWGVLTNRSVSAGKMLAEVLLSRQQGRRPVTLIGFSLGARVIFYCLQEMAKRKNSEGIIEDVVLLGAPVPSDSHEWRLFKRVVAGKIINGYCSGDWLLKFLYRTASVQMHIAGLEAIHWEDRRMHNVDLSEVVNGHMDYMNKLDDILSILGIPTKPRPKDETKADSLQKWVTARATCKTHSDIHVTKVTTSQSENAIHKDASSEHSKGHVKGSSTSPCIGATQSESDLDRTQNPSKEKKSSEKPSPGEESHHRNKNAEKDEEAKRLDWNIDSNDSCDVTTPLEAIPENKTLKKFSNNNEHDKKSGPIESISTLKTALPETVPLDEKALLQKEAHPVAHPVGTKATVDKPHNVPSVHTMDAKNKKH